MEFPKYISYNEGYGHIIVVFPPMIKHDDMVSRLRIKREHLLGAGQVNFLSARKKCFGTSVSLGLSPDQGDEKALVRTFNLEED